MATTHQRTTCSPVRRVALALAASGLLLSLAGCAGAGADKPATPPADGKGVSAKVPDELQPVMPAPAAPPSSAIAPETDAGVCNPDAAMQFVGQQANAANVEAARAAAVPTGTVRVIAPGQAVTMDYRPDRLNIEVDDQRVILKLRCG